MRRWGHRAGYLAVFAALAAVLVAGNGPVQVETSKRPRMPVRRNPAHVPTMPTSTVPPPPPSTTTTPPTAPPQTEPPPPPPKPEPTAAPAQVATPAPAPTPRFGAGVYGGLGTWIDVYDWSARFGPRDGSQVQLADIDRMADRGVQALYVQTTRFSVPSDVLERERLLPLIQRARARGMRVIAWYLPTLTDPGADLRRLVAASRLPVDGLAVDIEGHYVTDPAERSRRLVDLSRKLRAALPGAKLGAIVLPPVVTDVINRAYWPGFPWAKVAPLYDVWLPMSYWTNRTHSSGYRDAYRYTAENIDRVRAHLGKPQAIVHTIGGIGDESTVGDIRAMARAARERGCAGGSLYDYRTTHRALWGELRAMRS